MTEATIIKQQKKIAALFIVGILQVILFDCIYNFNCFNVNNVYYLHSGTQKYTIGEMLFNLDSVFLLIAISWAVKKSTNALRWMVYISDLAMNFFISWAILIIFDNPYMVNWNYIYCLIITTVIYSVKLILHFNNASFAKLGIYKIKKAP